MKNLQQTNPSREKRRLLKNTVSTGASLEHARQLPCPRTRPKNILGVTEYNAGSKKFPFVKELVYLTSPKSSGGLALSFRGISPSANRVYNSLNALVTLVAHKPTSKGTRNLPAKKRGCKLNKPSELRSQLKIIDLLWIGNKRQKKLSGIENARQPKTDEAGFEPADGVNRHRFSRPVPSTTRALIYKATLPNAIELFYELDWF